ncbi:MAG: hypothetical protein AAGJ28_16835 [Pseudomonadota bacterium]
MLDLDALEQIDAGLPVDGPAAPRVQPAREPVTKATAIPEDAVARCPHLARVAAE